MSHISTNFRLFIEAAQYLTHKPYKMSSQFNLSIMSKGNYFKRMNFPYLSKEGNLVNSILTFMQFFLLEFSDLDRKIFT